MSHDYITEQQEDEYDENHKFYLLKEAAIHVANGMDRQGAIKHVLEIDSLRSEAQISGDVILDDNGFVEEYLESELNTPCTEGMNKAQIDAIHKELCEQECVSLRV